jgi:hypothetical protein
MPITRSGADQRPTLLFPKASTADDKSHVRSRRVDVRSPQHFGLSPHNPRGVGGTVSIAHPRPEQESAPAVFVPTESQEIVSADREV